MPSFLSGSDDVMLGSFIIGGVVEEDEEDEGGILRLCFSATSENALGHCCLLLLVLLSVGPLLLLSGR